MSNYRFSFPTPIHFGAGVRNQLSEILKTQNLKRPLLVTDRGVAKLPFFKSLENQLSQAEIQPFVFSEIWGNPVENQVQSGVVAFHDHSADCVVGVGGGAALDVSKAIALMAYHPGTLFDYEDEKPGALPVDQPIPFLMALPTTSGTGSEVGRSSVISDEITHVKKIIFSPRLLPQVVLADPEVTLDLPASVTAATGIDALTHCIEAYLARGFHPICDGIALEGIRLAGQSLVACVKEPHHLEARSSMMMASLMGAIAFQKGLGLTHSCAHALSTVYDLHHGLANGLMIDHALKFNLPASEDRFKRIESTLGLSSTNSSPFLNWLTQLKKEIGIPHQLSAVGVSKDDLPRLSELAFQDSCHQNNPRPCRQEDFLRIFTEAYSND